jgi:hypothetical protein
MNRRILRRIAFSLIGMLLFMQGAVALAACEMDRGSMNMSQAAEAPCQHSDPASEDVSQGNLCIAHCTADLQLPSVAAAPALAPTDFVVVLVVPFREASAVATSFEVPPPRSIPPRILLHSFLL